MEKHALMKVFPFGKISVENVTVKTRLPVLGGDIFKRRSAKVLILGCVISLQTEDRNLSVTKVFVIFFG